MKPFARPAFLRDSLGYSRYYYFICHKGIHRYFPRFLTGSPCFGLPLHLCFSCSLKEPKQSSCRLYALQCVTNSQVLVTLGLSGSPLPQFYRSKSYFTHPKFILMAFVNSLRSVRHLNNGSFALNSSAHTIQGLDIRTSGFALTLTLSTAP